MSLALFNAVPAGSIEILYDERNQPWFKQVHIGEYISIVNMRDATSKIDPEDKKSRAEINVGSTDVSYTPPKHAKPHDDFLSVNGVTTILLNSRKPKARKVAAWLIRDIIPKGFNAIIAGKQQAIEERDNQLQAITYQNQFLVHDRTMLHNEIQNLVRNRHVPRSGDIDNILCVVEKNNPDETGKPGRHSYYMIRSQKKALSKHLNILRDKYPNMIVKEPECDDPNAVHCWNRFKTDILTKQNYYRNHFSLPEEVQELFEDMFDVDM